MKDYSKIEISYEVRSSNLMAAILDYSDKDDNSVWIDGIGKSKKDAKYHLMAQLANVITNLNNTLRDLEYEEGLNRTLC